MLPHRRVFSKYETITNNIYFSNLYLFSEVNHSKNIQQLERMKSTSISNVDHSKKIENSIYGIKRCT